LFLLTDLRNHAIMENLFEHVGGVEALHLAAADRAGLPADHAFREALRSHIEFGSQVAKQNSHAETDDQLHPLREVPLWQWSDAAE
jgi:hypothetical protein